MSGNDNVRQFTVGQDDDGIRVDRWFKRHLEGTSFTTVAKWARTGQLRVDGARVGPGDRVQAGQVLRVNAVLEKVFNRVDIREGIAASHGNTCRYRACSKRMTGVD